ncbi:TetR/AcrR family transcriptional regulator C-terminal domain-containing protein [Arthrobacter cavernae]|uniref:TetR/AcrR family transcriptional regulator C-terminal domain-containing protein n=1 Tax=Arthrobacter cavernae TaxID=2817681 RepID=A0A939HEZ7_9MICC|nr:TetR/AcrR family transcriptional regulator C-terminal domain-containing protein [Arthrobacter cavernae]MBO1269687.1 TetR/AcrR family transcriptional regulator C-terminal domain-containing protein [Arthrobacter cavernae]
MARPLTPLISIDAVVTAALELIDESGDFSLPKLAKRIGVSQSSIYNHVSGREEILELVRGRLLEESPLVVAADAGWEDVLREAIRVYRGSFARHPRTAPLMVMQTVRDPQAIALYERIAGALEAAGFEGADVASAIAMIDSFALGSALDLAAPGSVWEAAQGSSPALGRAVESAARLGSRADAAFEFGLEILIDGLRLRHERANHI